MFPRRSSQSCAALVQNMALCSGFENSRRAASCSQSATRSWYAPRRSKRRPRSGTIASATASVSFSASSSRYTATEANLGAASEVGELELDPRCRRVGEKTLRLLEHQPGEIVPARQRFEEDRQRIERLAARPELGSHPRPLSDRLFAIKELVAVDAGHLEKIGPRLNAGRHARALLERGDEIGPSLGR